MQCEVSSAAAGVRRPVRHIKSAASNLWRFCSDFENSALQLWRLLGSKPTDCVPPNPVPPAYVCRFREAGEALAEAWDSAQTCWRVPAQPPLAPDAAYCTLGYGRLCLRQKIHACIRCIPHGARVTSRFE